jgi:hypothetical protein
LLNTGKFVIVIDIHNTPHFELSLRAIIAKQSPHMPGDCFIAKAAARDDISQSGSDRREHD